MEDQFSKNVSFRKCCTVFCYVKPKVHVQYSQHAWHPYVSTSLAPRYNFRVNSSLVPCPLVSVFRHEFRQRLQVVFLAYQQILLTAKAIYKSSREADRSSTWLLTSFLVVNMKNRDGPNPDWLIPICCTTDVSAEVSLGAFTPPRSVSANCCR